MNTSITEKIRAAVIYCAMINERTDVRNDAANIYSDNYQEYNAICKALEFDN